MGPRARPGARRPAAGRAWRARAWRCSSRSPRRARATPPRWRSSTWAGTRSTSREPRSGLDIRETAEDVARTLACYHRVLCARVFDHALLGAHGGRARRAAASTSRSSTCSPTPPTPARPWPTCSRCARRSARCAGRTLTYVGDANNMARSLAKAALLEGMEVRIAVARPATPSRPTSCAACRPSPTRAGRGGDGPADRRPAPGGQGRGRALHRRVDEHGPGGGAGGPPGRLRRLHHRRRAGRPGRRPMPSCCTACRRTGARRSPTPVLEGPRSVVWRQAAHRRTAMRGDPGLGHREGRP